MKKNKIQNQHRRNVANFFASLIFIALVLAQLCTIWQLEQNPSLNLTDFILLSLATWRLTRLFVYDGAMSFLRDIFVELKEEHGQIVRVKKPYGIERTLSDIFGCPWCMTMWAGATFVWAYIMFPSIMLYVAVILSISAIASFLQLLTNLISWKAEHQKMIVERER